MNALRRVDGRGEEEVVCVCVVFGLGVPKFRTRRAIVLVEQR